MMPPADKVRTEVFADGVLRSASGWPGWKAFATQGAIGAMLLGVPALFIWNESQIGGFVGVVSATIAFLSSAFIMLMGLLVLVAGSIVALIEHAWRVDPGHVELRWRFGPLRGASRIPRRDIAAVDVIAVTSVGGRALAWDVRLRLRGDRALRSTRQVAHALREAEAMSVALELEAAADGRRAL